MGEEMSSVVERAVLVAQAFADSINHAVANRELDSACGLLAGEGGWRISLWQTPENREKLSAEAVGLLEQMEAQAK